MSTSTKGPAYYPPALFHLCRVTSGLSCTIVAGILIYFCLQLKNDGFKIPWTFLLVIVAAICNLIALVATVVLSCCCSRSPLIKFLINLPVLILWAAAFSIFVYNIYGLLSHSCSISVWAVSEGVTVCNVYKTLFTFMIFACLTQLILVALDVKARRAQVKEGKYNKMDASTDLKTNPVSTTTGFPSPAQSDIRDDSAGWRPGVQSTDKNGVVTEQYELQQQYHQRDDLSPNPHHNSPYAQPNLQSPQYTHVQHGTPEFVGSPYSDSSQYQTHNFSRVHESSRMNQYAYDHSPQSLAYDHRGYGYQGGRGY